MPARMTAVAVIWLLLFVDVPGGLPPAVAQVEAPAPRVDRWGDPLPACAVARLGTTRLRHGSFIDDVAFSPDGKLMASGGHGETVRVWEVATGREVGRFEGHDTYICKIAFSPDGETIASGDLDGIVRLWRIADGRQIHASKLGRLGIDALLWMPDGETLFAFNRGGEIPIHRLRTVPGDFGHEEQKQYGDPYCVALSPDGKLLITGGNHGTIRLWNPESGKLVGEMVAEPGPVAAPRPPDDRRIIVPVAPSSTRRGLIITEVATDGRTIVSIDHKTPGLRLWDARTGKEIRRLGPDTDTDFRHCAIAADGRSIVASPDIDSSETAPFWQWNARTGELIRRFGELPSWEGNLVASPDGRTLATWGWHTVQLWSLQTGRRIHPSTGGDKPIWSVALGPDGRTLVTADLNEVRVWDVARQNEQRMLARAPVSELGGPPVALSTDGRLLVSDAQDRGLRAIDTATGREVQRFEGPPGRSGGVALSADGQRLACSDGRSVEVWDIATGRPRLHFGDTASAVTSLALSPDGKRVAVGYWRFPVQDEAHDLVQIRDATTGKLRSAVAGHRGPVRSVAFSPDGRLLASTATVGDVESGNPTSGVDTELPIHLWDPKSAEERWIGESLRGYFQVVFSPDGRMLATAGKDGQVSLWERATGRLRRRFPHAAAVMSVAFSADGKRLASGSSDTTALVWNVFAPAGGRRREKLSGDELEALWNRLAADDAGRAFDTVCTLVAAPNSAVPFIGERLQPVEISDDRVKRLIGELNNDRFEARERAAAELQALGERAEPALRTALKRTRSVEVRARAERLLLRLDEILLPAAALQNARAIEVLEHIGSEPARRILQKLSKGAPEARLTRAAADALQRMDPLRDPE